MKFLLLFVFLFSCSEKKSDYFPLKKIKSWTYSVEIIPEVEKKILYKKTNTSLGERKIKVEGKEKSVFPVLREDGTTFYYEISNDGIYRKGVRYLKDKKISFDKKRLVLPKPVKLDKKWSNDSKTFLILRRYPYYDYKATTNFEINYEITSVNQSIKTPYGKEIGSDSTQDMSYIKDTSTKYSYTSDQKDRDVVTTGIGFDFVHDNGLTLSTDYERKQNGDNDYFDSVFIAANFLSRKESQYSLSFQGSDGDLVSQLEASKRLGLFDITAQLENDFTSANHQLSLSASHNF